MKGRMNANGNGEKVALEKMPGLNPGKIKPTMIPLKFIDWLIRLPEGLTEQLSKKIAILEEEYKMPYVTSWERLREKKGKNEGKKEEKLETAKRMLLNDFSVEQVITAAGLTETEVKTLIN